MKRILHVVSSVDPVLGGVSESILRRGERIVELGHKVEVVSLDAPDAEFIASYPLPLHALGPGRSRWCYAPALTHWLRENCRRFDCVIVEGIWQYHAHATRIALKGTGVPYMVFPHGMLDPWFKSEYPLKHLKKWLFWPWAEYRVLRDAAAVLFTCEEERRLARQSFWLYRANEQVVPFGTAAPPPITVEVLDSFYSTFPKLKGKRFLLYLSRLHPKKGCDLLISAFGRIANDYPDLQLLMAGPGDPDYVELLKVFASTNGVAARTHWPGMIKGNVKWGAIEACDAFVLPSHQENFGIAVVEAIACGKAALISNKVNIHQEISAGKAGYVDEDSLEGIERVLLRWLNTSEHDKKAMSSNGRKTFTKYFSIDSMAQGLISTIERIRK